MSSVANFWPKFFSLQPIAPIAAGTGSADLPTITRRLTALVLAAVLPLLIFSIFLFMLYAQDQRIQYEHQIQATSRTASLAIDAGIARQLGILSTLGFSRSFKDRDWRAFYDLARASVADQPNARVVLYDPSGQTIISTLVPYGTDLPRAGDLDAIRSVVETRLPYISDLFVGAVSKELAVAIDIPIIKNGAVVNILGIALPPDFVSKIILSQTLPETDFAVLIDRKGIIIARSRGQFVGHLASPGFVEAAQKSTEGIYRTNSVEGIPIRAAFTKSGLSGWTVSLGINEAALEAPLRRSLWIFGSGGGLFLAVALALAFYHGRSFVQPVVALTAMAQSLGRGDHLLQTRFGIREAQIIGDQMVLAAEGLKRHANERENLLATLEQRVEERTRQLREHQAKLEELTRFDLLTGLKNRRAFVEALDREIARMRRGRRTFAILYLDLDHFKDINDTLGHPVGDLLLQAVAERLRANVRSLDTVARFGGDEFAIIVTDIQVPTDAAVVSERVLNSISEPIPFHEAAATAAGVAVKILSGIQMPFVIQNNEIRLGTSIGITICDEDSADAEILLSQADVALYQAKSGGRGTYGFFTEAMDAEVRARVSMTMELHRAIDSDQLFLVYQPQVDIEAGRIVGLEALVRWQHPVRGVVSPAAFIPEAERSGLIVPLGRWVMREACRQTKQWLDAGIAPPLIAVNMSNAQFKRPLELESQITTVLAETGLPARFLELELTETVLMEVSRQHNDLLSWLCEQGCLIAIDDFGIGYSSLDYLRRYPVHRIKIAQSFIADIGIVSGSESIVRAALGLARELGIETVVEGVETAMQLELLKTWGCRIVQGFYFARPLPVPEVTALLRIGTIAPTRADSVELRI